MLDFAKAGMHTPVLGQMYYWRVTIHDDKSQNVDVQSKAKVSRLLVCDNTEYEGILAAQSVGIYIRANMHSTKMMRSGSTSCRVIMCLADCKIMDYDIDSEIEVCHVNCRV
ncbi:hypothetical protein B9Z19DRAFT_1125181 [Tuber borchii]|uniref:Uncharacterized protein n=1 Tax=Tuber borchii TaxID=42251 RepID=A0A2T6ZVE8_TUBBO|nr:hypothetical protein B9Z19DRAFT_1125181 [Tuber borchii]